MEQFYNKHYIKVDSSNRVVEGWSDGPHRDKDTTDAICINDKGGYQFRINGGEENPALFDWNGIMPLYKYEGGEVVKRTEEEIEADRAALAQPDPTPTIEQRVGALEESNTELNEAVTMLLEGVTE